MTVEMIQETITDFTQIYSNEMRGVVDNLYNIGYFRRYTMPPKRKHGGQLRSRRELRDIRKQRKTKPFGVWRKDFTTWNMPEQKRSHTTNRFRPRKKVNDA